MDFADINNLLRTASAVKVDLVIKNTFLKNGDCFYPCGVLISVTDVTFQKSNVKLIAACFIDSLDSLNVFLKAIVQGSILPN